MSNDTAPEQEVIDIGDLDIMAFNEYAVEQGWGDGLPLYPPTEERVAEFVSTCHGDNRPFDAMSPRRVHPTLPSIAANAVMAGCRPAYFPTVVAAVRAVLQPDYNLHGTLATTHPCAPALILNGPVRAELEINCAGNCFGQGWRANSSIGRALQLALRNIGGAHPGTMDRSTQGSPAKMAFCFGENEEESPWEPYHVRRGYAANDSVVTALPCEAPHNINDHGSNTGAGILMTIAGAISQTGANTIYRTAPYVVALGPEHAATLKRDGWTIEDMQSRLFEDTAVHVSRVSPENRANLEEWGQAPENDRFYLSRTAEDIQILVAGGPGKHSAYMPTFGFTEVCSERI
ncbi:MAG: hypothetical protein AAF458_03730 [Pseudomonadota bacterium]